MQTDAWQEVSKGAIGLRDRLSMAWANVLNVKRGERRKTLAISALALVLGCALYSAFNATQAIFLIHTGVHSYPLFFVVLALSVWPAIALHAKSTRKLGNDGAFRLTLLANIILGIVLFLVYARNESYWVSFIAYLAYSLSFEIAMLQFWSFVNPYFNVGEAKRILPLIAAASGLGYILAGGITIAVTTLMNRPEWLLLVWSLGSALAGFICMQIKNHFAYSFSSNESDDFLPFAAIKTRHKGFFRDSWLSVKNNRLILALLAMGLLLLIAMRISDYLVAIVFVNSTSNLSDLTILIGNAWMISYLLQIVLGLWFTPWLLTKIGTKNTLLALPVFSLIGFLGVLGVGGLGSGLFLFLVRNGVQPGVDDPTQNILTSVLPNLAQSRYQFLQNNLVLPLGAMIAGILLLVIRGIYGDIGILLLCEIGFAIAIVFALATLLVRRMYVNALFGRLREHTLSMTDLDLALGRLRKSEVVQLKRYLDSHNADVRREAAATLARRSPKVFASLAPILIKSTDAVLRRLVFEMNKSNSLSYTLIYDGLHDPDCFVKAMASVCGTHIKRFEKLSNLILEELSVSTHADERASAVAAAAATGNIDLIALALTDPSSRVRLEAIVGYAKLKGHVSNSATGLLKCLCDDNLEVRRRALSQAKDWHPGRKVAGAFTDALIASLSHNDALVRRRASVALAIQCSDKLDLLMPLLEKEAKTSISAIETIFRSSRTDLQKQAKLYLQISLEIANEASFIASRLQDETSNAKIIALRVALQDYQNHTSSLCLAALRIMHEKKGFERIEMGLSTSDSLRSEAIETLLNFGPTWLADPLVKLIEQEPPSPLFPQPLSSDELSKLLSHPHSWVAKAARALHIEDGDNMKDLIALKKVSLFSNLSLEQLAVIDRAMVTRKFKSGEKLFSTGEKSDELYVILEGDVEIQLGEESQIIVLATLGQNDVLGEMAPLTDKPRSANAVALTPTVTRVLRKDRLGAILKDHPELLLGIVKDLSQRLIAANAHLQEKAKP